MYHNFYTTQVILWSGCITLLFIFWSYVIVRLKDAFEVRVVLPKLKKVRQAKIWPALADVEQMDAVAQFLSEAGLTVDSNKNTLAYIVIGFLLVLFFLDQYFLFMLSMVTCFSLVVLLVNRRKKIMAEMQNSFPLALEILIGSLRAGFSFSQAVQVTARECHGSMAKVFAALARAYEYQLSVPVAVQLIGAQLKMEDWDNFSDCLYIHANVGGDIIPSLEELNKTIITRQEIVSETKTSTASGKMSGLIIAALAPVGCVMFYAMSPEYILPLFTTVTGNLLLVYALISEIIGVIWISRIVRIDF